MEPRLISMIVASRWDASGGRKSRGRTALLEILQTKTAVEVAREIGCTPMFVSLMASGKRKPGHWILVRKIHQQLGISGDDWSE